MTLKLFPYLPYSIMWSKRKYNIIGYLAKFLCLRFCSFPDTQVANSRREPRLIFVIR
jgi:hypothetical protein